MSEPMDIHELEVVNPHQPSVDLAEVRAQVEALRDVAMLQQELEAELSRVRNKRVRIEREILPDLFNQAGISELTVEAQGNYPPFTAVRTTVYTATMPKDPDKHKEALEWFESSGHGDLVKANINIVYGMGDYDARLETMKLLDEHKISYNAYESVHNSTLRAFVKRELLAERLIPNDLLGVYVFDEIKIK